MKYFSTSPSFTSDKFRCFILITGVIYLNLAFIACITDMVYCLDNFN